MFKDIKNAKFKRRMYPLLTLSLITMYYYSGLQNDHINILQPYYASIYKWNALTITNPVTYAAYAAIIFTFIVGTLLMKSGVVKITAGGTIILGLATIGLAFAGNNYAVYTVSLFIVRLMVVPLQMGSAMLCANWFIRLRGHALGFIAAGCPLETATLIALMTFGVASSLGFTGTYAILGGIAVIIGILDFALLKDMPEDCGLFPDGDDERPAEPPASTLTFKEIFRNKNSWFVVISMGFLQFIIIGVMAFFVARMKMKGVNAAVYLPALTVSALLGIACSNLLGTVSDKHGTPKASLILCCAFLLVLFPLLFLAHNTILMVCLATIGIAGITGGTPSLCPAMTIHVFGRKNYQAANRWIYTVQNVIGAFAVLFMSAIFTATGDLAAAYWIMIGFVVIAGICFILLTRTPNYEKASGLQAQAYQEPIHK